MKLLIIFATSAVLLQYHFATTAPGGDEHESHSKPESSIQTELPKELANYELLNKTFIEGAVSDVEWARNKQNRTEVVIKITSKLKTKGVQPPDAINIIIEMARKEGDILEHLLPHHSNIVQFEKFVETTENLYLVVEYLSQGSLFKLLKSFKLDENKARVIFKQVFAAIKHCHEHEIVHRDLKTDNLLFDSNHNIKLIDFGYAHKLKQGESLKEYSGSPFSWAPEVKTAKESKSGYDGFKSDIWTLGVVLYELVCGPIWPGTNVIVNRASALGMEEILYPKQVPITYDAKHLISNILRIDPNKRLSLQQIENHKWMKMGGSKTQSG